MSESTQDIIGEINPPGFLEKHGSVEVGEGFGLINFLSNILRLAIVVAGLFGLINLILAGYDYITAGGDPEKIKNANSKIFNSLIGLIVIAASFTLAAILSYLLFGDPTMIIRPRIFGPGTSWLSPTPALAEEEGTPLGSLEGLPGGFDPGESIDTASTTLTKIFSNTFGVLTIVGGLMFILFFVLGGLSWLTSSGDREKVEKAKKQMTNAAIGLIIVVASYSIAFVIGRVLGVEILSPARYIQKLGPQGGGEE